MLSTLLRHRKVSFRSSELANFQLEPNEDLRGREQPRVALRAAVLNSWTSGAATAIAAGDKDESKEGLVTSLLECVDDDEDTPRWSDACERGPGVPS